MKVKQRALPALQRRFLLRADHRCPDPRYASRMSGHQAVLLAAHRSSGAQRDSWGCIGKRPESMNFHRRPGTKNEREWKPWAGSSRLPAWRRDLEQVGTRFVMKEIQLCPVYPFSLSNAPPLMQDDGNAGLTEIFPALKINPNSGLHPSDTRSHGSRRSFSLSSDRPSPTSTGRDYSPPGRADQDRSAARGGWPRNAGIP